MAKIEKFENSYIYALALSNEVIEGANSTRVSVDDWLTVLNKGPLYAVYIGISRAYPSRRLSRHQSKKLYAEIANMLNIEVDNKKLVMHVLSDYMGFKPSEWTTLAKWESTLIDDFKQTHGHEPILQVPAPDSGISTKEWKLAKRELGQKLATLSNYNTTFRKAKALKLEGF